MVEFIAEIRDRNRVPCGMGILIASDQVLTCAHVVNLALKRDIHDAQKPDSDVNIDVCFPSHPGRVRKGTVQDWHAPELTQDVNDCCLLTLRSPLGNEVKPARFGEAKSSEEFKAPRSTGTGPMEWAFGSIGEPSNHGLQQVNKSIHEERKKSFIKAGNSGGPAISCSDGAVLGMVAWANQDTEQAHIISSQTLNRACGVPVVPRPKTWPSGLQRLKPWMASLPGLEWAGLAALLLLAIAWIVFPDWRPFSPRASSPSELTCLIFDALTHDRIKREFSISNGTETIKRRDDFSCLVRASFLEPRDRLTIKCEGYDPTPRADCVITPGDGTVLPPATQAFCLQRNAEHLEAIKPLQLELPNADAVRRMQKEYPSTVTAVKLIVCNETTLRPDLLLFPLQEKAVPPPEKPTVYSIRGDKLGVKGSPYSEHSELNLDAQSFGFAVYVSFEGKRAELIDSRPFFVDDVVVINIPTDDPEDAEVLNSGTDPRFH